MSNECEGCRSYTQTYCSYGLIHNISNTNGCPCKTCLVKGVCVSICEEFINYKLLSREIKDFDSVLRDFNKMGVDYSVQRMVNMPEVK